MFSGPGAGASVGRAGANRATGGRGDEQRRQRGFIRHTSSGGVMSVVSATITTTAE